MSVSLIYRTFLSVGCAGHSAVRWSYTCLTRCCLSPRGRPQAGLDAGGIRHSGGAAPAGRRRPAAALPARPAGWSRPVSRREADGAVWPPVRRPARRCSCRDVYTVYSVATAPLAVPVFGTKRAKSLHRPLRILGSRLLFLRLFEIKI